MLKEIKFGGLSAQPSDYSCPDGDLALAVNVSLADGALEPISRPVERLSLSDGHRLLLIHRVEGGSRENYIILSSGGAQRYSILWIQRADSKIQNTMTAAKITGSDAASLSGFKSIAVLGNTLCLSDAEGLHYILWKDDEYHYLGQRPPQVAVQFSCSKVDEINEETDSPGKASNSLQTTITDIIQRGDRYEGTLASQRGKLHFGSDEDKSYWADVVQAAMGLLYSQVAEKVTSQGYFYQPFFVRYAFRLFDGSYSWHSAPVLMLPVMVPPVIYCYHDGRNASIQLLASVPYFRLDYRLFADLEALKDWSDVIAGIDFFISEPIYTFTSEPRNDGPTVVFEMLRYAYQLGASRLVGIYGGATYDTDETLLHSPVNWCIDMQPNPNFEEQLQSRALFYKVASIELEKLRQTTGFESLPLDNQDLTNIATLPTLPDDYNSHATLLPSTMHAFNQRLLLSGLSIMPPKPFPVSVAAQYIAGGSDAQKVSRVRVYTRINGQRCVSEYSASSSIPEYPIGRGAEFYPRYLYHPDPSAYMMEITTAGGSVFRLPLSPHPYLSGAFFYGGIHTRVSIKAAPAQDVSNTVGHILNKVYLSQVSNPFLFPVESIVTVDCGRIFRLSTAAKALSQGQFGQFPVYAFTDDGVWALEVSSTGIISARQPITRDVCIAPDGITQIDSAVLFPTSRGIMLIAGSQTVCISDPVNSPVAFPLDSFKGFSEIAGRNTYLLSSMSRISFPSSLIPFPEFLKDIRMVYDYPHQRIIAFNPSQSYFYVYSLSTKSWSLGHGSLSYTVNSYPEGMAVDSRGTLLDFSAESRKTAAALILSRPWKLDLPDVLKTVSTVISRGLFSKGSVYGALYGSRDLHHWHLVWSSKDHFLRGFSGSPYKYFRLALSASLDSGQSLSGASVEFEPKKSNQLR